MRNIARAGLILKANGLEKDFVVKENSVFDDLCLMIDCSRNAVRNIPTIKKIIRNIAMAGYNSLMLYTEDTYEIDGEPMFGYLRGRYTKEEMKELNNYANEWGIEMIPCIQTLAHMNQLARYKYSHFKCFDCSDILLVGSERTYQLIDAMFKTLSECYTTRKIHIGMDEAAFIGRGKFLDSNGYKNSFDILKTHLEKVCGLAEKYGFKPMIWSDMFCGLACKHGICEVHDGVNYVPESVIDAIPKNLSLCHWNYHYVKEEDYHKGLDTNVQFNRPIWFAGGTVEDNRGFIPHLTYSLKVAKAAISAAKKYKIKHLIETVWGDNGGECSLFAVLPAIFQYSYCAYGIADDRLKKEFFALTGYSFDDFMKIEQSQTFCGKYTEDLDNPAKYGLYNDVFTGYVDTVINSEDKEYFKKAKESISDLRHGQYGYLFETAFELCEILQYKYDLGIRLRNAYQKKDTEKLKDCSKDLEKIITGVEKFIVNYRNQWHKENKPNGIEVQEFRLGGLKERLKGCKERLDCFINGKCDIIPELEEKLNEKTVSRTKDNGRCDLFSFEAIASVNAFDGFTEVDV